MSFRIFRIEESSPTFEDPAGRRLGPAVASLVEDIQAVLRKHDAEISGDFALHTNVSKRAECEENEQPNRRLDGDSLYFVQELTATGLEKRK